MKTIVILADSINRRYLPAYGNDFVKTPNLDRLQKQSCVFDNHWTGSTPCMPARRDMFTGRINFLERCWGPIEPYDTTLPQLLREQGVRSHIYTDHYHYRDPVAVREGKTQGAIAQNFEIKRPAVMARQTQRFYRRSAAKPKQPGA